MSVVSAHDCCNGQMFSMETDGSVTNAAKTSLVITIVDEVVSNM